MSTSATTGNVCFTGAKATALLSQARPCEFDFAPTTRQCLKEAVSGELSPVLGLNKSIGLSCRNLFSNGKRRIVMNIFVGNLSFQTTEQELQRNLRHSGKLLRSRSSQITRRSIAWVCLCRNARSGSGIGCHCRHERQRACRQDSQGK